MKSIGIVSGKGGVGKSVLALNLALAMGLSGKKVLLADADMRLPGLDVLAGLPVDGDAAETVAEAVNRVGGAIDLLPMPARRLRTVERAAELVDQLKREGSVYDVVLFDGPSGLDADVCSLLAECDALIVVVEPEPLSLLDGLSVVSVADGLNPNAELWAVANRVVGGSQGQVTLGSFALECARATGASVRALGWVPASDRLASSSRTRVPVVAGVKSGLGRRLAAMGALLVEPRVASSGRPILESLKAGPPAEERQAA